MSQLLAQSEIDDLLNSFEGGDVPIDIDTVNSKKRQDIRTHLLYNNISVVKFKRCKTRQKGSDNEFKLTNLIYLSDNSVIVDVFPFECGEPIVVQITGSVKAIYTHYIDTISSPGIVYSNPEQIYLKI